MLHKSTLLTLVVISFAGLVGLVLYGERTLLPYLPFFLLGILVARFEKYQPSFLAATSSALTVVFILVIFTIITTLRATLFGGAHPGPLFVYNTPLNVLVTLLAMLYAMNTVARPSRKLDKLLSDASYSLYLFHWIPVLILGHYFPWISKSGMIERASWTLLALAMTYAISFGITLWIDRPINERRTRFVKGRLII